jgi:hypothetical protein
MTIAQFDSSTEDQDLMLGRLTRQLKETERFILTLQANLKLSWQELMSATDDVVPVMNQMKTDKNSLTRARSAAMKMPDREAVIEGLRELDESIVRTAELRKAIEEMVI